MHQLRQAGLAQLLQLGESLNSWSLEIAVRWHFTRNNAITEGFHTKMEVLSRQAYGFRSFNNCRLRVKMMGSRGRSGAGYAPINALANLSSWPATQVDLLRRLLKGEYLVARQQVFQILRSLPHGHVAAVLDTLVGGSAGSAPGCVVGRAPRRRSGGAHAAAAEAGAHDGPGRDSRRSRLSFSAEFCRSGAWRAVPPNVALPGLLRRGPGGNI